MIGVLLASAPSGTDRPGFGGAADLISGGLRARYQSARRRLTDVNWQDALAVCTIAIPLVLVASFVSEWAYYQHLSFGAWYVQVEMGLVVLAAAAPSLLALRYRRLGALAALALTVVGVASMAGSVVHTWDWVVYGEVISSSLAYGVLAVALLKSPGPRRGNQILRPGTWLVLVGAGAVMGLNHAYLLRLSTLAAAVLVLGVLAVVAAGLVLTLPGPVARGALLLLAVPTYPGAVWAIGQSAAFASDTTRFPSGVAFAPTVLLMVLAAIALKRGGASSAAVHPADG